MKQIFSPAISLMNRLGYTSKFTLLSSMAITAFILVAHSLYASLDQEIRILHQKLDGLALIRPVSHSVQLLQQHRGLSAAALGGSQDMENKRRAYEKEVSGALAEVGGRLNPGLKEAESWRSIKKDWDRLLREGAGMTMPDNFAAHTQLIERLLVFQGVIADEYALTLDSHIDTYYLIDTAINKLPGALEHVGQLRAYGVGVLTGKQISERQKISIYKIIGMLDDAHHVFEINFEKTGRHNPVLKDSLSAALKDIADSTQLVTDAIESDILSGRLALLPEEFFKMATLAIDRGYAQMLDNLLPTAEGILKERIAQAEKKLYVSIGFALLLLLVMVYLAIAVYFSIVGNVQLLAQSAHAFANGNLGERAHLDTHDELGQIGDSFNVMAESFNAMLVAQKQTQQKLQRNQDLLKEAQRLGKLGSWEFNLIGRDLKWSDEIYRIFELDPGQFLPSYENFLSIVHPEDRVMVDQAYTQLLRDREPYDVEHRLLLANGRIKWVREHCTSEFDTSGKPLRSVGVVQDITGRRQADDRLRVAAIAFETNDGITITDAGCNIIRVNKAFEAITGYSETEVFGKNPRILSSGRQGKDFYTAMWHELKCNGTWTGELWNKRKNGQIYPERLTITAVKNSIGEVTEYVAVFRDITERKQAEEKLQKYNEELEAANQRLAETQSLLLQSEKMSAIGQLAAGVAHEINNPIGYVYSNLGTLEKYVQDAFGMIEQYEGAEGAIADDAVRARLKAAREKLDIEFLKEDLSALMNESKDGITRVKKIVQNLKDFSHVDASDEWHFADLHKGLDSTLNIVHNEIKYKADVVKEYGDLPEVECLSSQLNQVFMNLLVNAAHAIEGHGTITIRTGRQDEEVWVEIADTGKGIAPEHIKKIFDPFFTTKPIGKGTGLGLSLSYGIVQKHHGRIEVQSEPGKGTTFRVWLPVSQPEAGTA